MLQLVASFIGYEDQHLKGSFDFMIEADPDGEGSIETLKNNTESSVIKLPTGLGDMFIMTEEQQFEALRHMQNRTMSLAEAFGEDIEAKDGDIQFQGVMAMLNPIEMIPGDCGCPYFGKSYVEKIAFMYRDGYLMISTRDEDGVWHSDAKKLREELEGLTFTDLAAVLGKILGEIQISIWMWAALGACAVATAGSAVILCILAILAYGVASTAFIIAIIEEVTGRPTRIASYSESLDHLSDGQLASCRLSMEDSFEALHEHIGDKFPYPNLGTWLKESLAETEIALEG